MNALKLNLFDTAFLAQTPSAAGAIRPAKQTVPTPLPASLWRQSLAAMDHTSTGRAHRAAQVCYVVLGTLTAGSVVVAATTLFRCVCSHDGLHAAVQTLMSR